MDLMPRSFLRLALPSPVDWVVRYGQLVTALANGPGILGMDISEIAPIEGFVAPQFCIARLIYRMLGRINAGRRVH